MSCCRRDIPVEPPFSAACRRRDIPVEPPFSAACPLGSRFLEGACLESAAAGLSDGLLSCADSEDLRGWLLEIFRRQQASLRSLVIQQHESLQTCLEDRFDLADRSFDNRLTQFTVKLKETHRAQADVRLSAGAGTGEQRGDDQEATAPLSRQSSPEPSKSPEPSIEDSADIAPGAKIRVSFDTRLSFSSPGAEESFAEMNGCEIVKAVVKTQQFEIAMGLVILANMLAMFCQLEWEGYEASVELGIRPSGDHWPGAEIAFAVLDECFNVIYLTELALRFWVFRWGWFRDFANVLDTGVVLATCFDAYVLRPIHGAREKGGLSIGGLIKVFRVLRIMKVFRLLTAFPDLRVLMRSVVESAGAFMWSMLLLGNIILAAGVFMAQLAIGFIYDDTLSPSTRDWLYTYYGSAARSTYTMFESTFSGVWVNRARPMIEDVNAAFAVVWILYVIVVTFAMIRVVAALFLKQTMQAASSDSEKENMQKVAAREATATKIQAFFSEGDESGDGLLSPEEFAGMLKNPKLVDMLQDLDLELYEVTALFSLLQDSQGSVSCEDFVSGAMQLKGHQRSIDAITLQHEQHVMHKLIAKVAFNVEALTHALPSRPASNASPRGPTSPRSTRSTRPRRSSSATSSF